MSEVIPKRIAEVKWRSEDENLVLYTATDNRIIVLNQTAAFIWKLADGEKTAEEIADEVVEEYENVTRDKALKDVHKVIQNLKSKNLVTVV
ncbi:MAG: PqqD family protein [Theionarchaea archaeon]|nr:PqqD family protein [Theionarchaea archaeon]MBU7038817.1 PqqD family protein [Theionarchaea archaeon]